MLDIKFIRENIDSVRKNIKNRNANCDLDAVLKLEKERNDLIQLVENLRKKRNQNGELLKKNASSPNKEEILNEGKKIKEELFLNEEKLRMTEENFLTELKRIPNMSHAASPLGFNEEDARELYKVGTPVHKNFIVKNHEDIGSELDLIDFKMGAKTTGQKFYFLKNEAVLLELALSKYAIDVALKHGYKAHITPDIAKIEILEGIGFAPRGAESNIYGLYGMDLSLIATAEITLGGAYSGETLDSEELPIKISGISHCFRRESGSYGKFSKGLYRVHQFTKIELFAICLPQDSDSIHQEILSIEEEITGGLGIPYRVIDTPVGDLGAPAFRKFDIEAFMPCRGQNGEYGEITSTSNCTDYQARRLDIRYKDKNKKGFAHTLNGTAIAIPRIIISILENFQNKDGSVNIPEVLVPYLGFKKIERKQKK